MQRDHRARYKRESLIECSAGLHGVSASTGNPSGTVAIVFQLFPAEWISKAVALILSSTEHATDDAIRKTVNVLCRWLRLCAFCQNLNLWVLAILNRLREQQKYNLLFDIALDVVEPLFLALIIPILRPMIAPVLFHVLSSVKHTPEVFHKVEFHLRIQGNAHLYEYFTCRSSTVCPVL